MLKTETPNLFLRERITACMQIRRCVMKFCSADKISTHPAYLIMLKARKLDKISIVTANKHYYVKNLWG